MRINSSVGIALLFALPPAAAQPVRNSTIAGRVLNAATGAPVRYAAVEIMVDGKPGVRGVAPSQADGTFLLRALPAGRYRINVTRLGYAATSYGAAEPGAPGQVITIGANENLSGLLIRLPRLGTIRGTVSVSGAPAPPGLHLSLYRLDYLGGRPAWVPATPANATVQSGGRYQLDLVRPGRYVIAADPQPPRNVPSDLQPVPVRTFYPSALLDREATIVEVGASTELDPVDIALRTALPILLTIQPRFPADAQVPANQTLRIGVNSTGAGLNRWESTANYPQRSALPLAAGRYTLTGLVTINGACFSARKETNLTSGPITVDLPFSPCLTLPGRIRVAGSAPLADVRVTAVSADSWPERLDPATPSATGTFALTGLPAGTLHLTVEPLPPGTFLESITRNGRDVLRDGFTLNPETSGPVEVVLSSRGADLSGNIVQGYATAVLAAPQGDAAQIAIRYATTGTDTEGRFQFHHLAPGPYRLYAFEHLRPDAWLTPGFLDNYAAFARDVTLRDGENPPVELRTIPGVPRKGGK